MEFYDERLHNMLRYKRPHNSTSEAAFTNAFLIDKYECYYLGKEEDPAAYFITVGESRTMFSCHIDTVHHSDGMQRVKYDREKKVYYKADKECLGADDTAGCWLLLEMIDAGVPGTYVFHRGEERGGIGSSYISEHHPEFLMQFDRAIAFDRRGSTDVITHQGWTRCASTAFADYLADRFNEDGHSMYCADDTGVFTDTANYTDLIPECTNISCGYMHEHTANETLHLPTLFALRDNCLRIDWEALPVERDPSKVEYFDDGGWQRGYLTTTGGRYKETDTDYLEGADLYRMSRSEMNDLAYTDPETFVNLVRQELFGEFHDKEDTYETLRYGY